MAPPLARYFALAVVGQGRVGRNCVVEALADGSVAVRPFSGEEAVTVGVSGIVAVCNGERLTVDDRAALTALVAGAPTLDRAIAAASAYLAAHGLYLAAAAPAVLLPLPRR